ncbi:MAG: hypothetical protein IT454_10355 [Planctomycetes bacterium]|nr:hypothetical protein [Planctomycetota bacterium]
MKHWIAIVSSCLVAACSTDDKASSGSASAALDGFWSQNAPQGARSVLEVRADAKAGDEVVVRGRAKDFVSSVAALTIVDPTLRACSDEGDPMAGSCETPWDYCCIPAKEVAAASATVEFRDGANPLKGSAQGFHGLNHLDTLVVSGIVERDASGNMTVVAKSFAFTPNPPSKP